MITRDAVQGFIDGWNAAQNGSGLSAQVSQNILTKGIVQATPQLSDYVGAWLTNHPIYPQDADTAAQIVSTLASYRDAPVDQ